MISYGKQFIDQKDVKGVLKTLKSDYLTQGSNVDLFESKLSKYLKTKYTVCVSSGTAGLHIISKVLNWKKNDIIISSPITFIAGVTSVMHCGATPDFVDIDKQTLSLDLNKLEDRLKKRSIRGVIVTDFAGQPSDWTELFFLKKKYKFDLINDNCHSIGSVYKKNVGYAAKYSDFSCLSFHPVKHITTCEGGAILTNNKHYYEKSKLFRSHCIIKTKNKKKNQWFYRMNDAGFNYRMNEISASLGITQLSKINKFLKYRKKVAFLYNKAFEKLENINIPEVKLNRDHTYHLYPLQINFTKLKKSRSKLFQYFKKNNINLQVHYIPVFFHPIFKKKKYKFKYSNFENTLEYYNKTISLPIYYNLQKKKIDKVCKLIKNFIKTKK